MKNSDALYIQIRDQLLREILRGDYADGKRLPTEMELAKKFYVSRITSKKALNDLAESGAVVRIPGRGSFVRKDFVAPSAPAIPRGASTIALAMGGYGSTFGLDIVNGAMERCEELGMHLIVKNTQNNQQIESKILQDLIHSGVSGLIVQPTHGELYNEVLLNAVYSKYPIVMIDRKLDGINAPFIGVDNLALGKFAANKLIAKGHNNIALIAMADDHSSSLRERMTGLMEALMDAHMPVSRELWLTRLNDHINRLNLPPASAQSHEAIVSLVMDHLKANPEITAIFATEYSATKAAWDAATRMGMRIPLDFSIIGFDYDSSDLNTGLLSHIRQPQREIGCMAVDALAGIMAGEPPRKREHFLEGIWVDGQSVAAPPVKRPIKLTSLT